MTIEHRPGEGTIADGNIRYVLMRPDVLMGAARHLGPNREGEFLAALEASAFAHAQASFAAYRDAERFGRADFLASTGKVAAELGWGRWRVSAEPDGTRSVYVDNSPFAAGFGASSRPVCGPITGVLRAIALVGYGQNVAVEEVACSAQGAKECCFRLALPREK
jgi:predicted hydrocarbon binding protein